MYLYLTESAVKVGLASRKLTVKSVVDGSIVREFPFSDVEGISVFGMPQFSTQLLRECIRCSVPVLFYSDDGHYFGHLSSSEHVDPVRQKRQIGLSDNPAFCLEWSRGIVRAKIANSLALLRSMPEIYVFGERELNGLLHSLKYLDTAESVPQVLGFEGNAAKAYFSCLPKLLRDESFLFSGRSSRPPKDPFNSMLSFGYSIIYRNIIGAVEAAGLHPYFAFMHASKQGHAALASDLVEEWRAWIVDKTMVDLVNAGEVLSSDFYTNDTGAVYMQKNVMQTLARSLGDIMVRNEAYLLEDGDKRRYGFQVALRKKVLMVTDAIEQGNPALYKPFLWRV